jgi:hypothetical protein
VKLCGAALPDYANARDVVAREIADGPYAAEIKAAISRG